MRRLLCLSTTARGARSLRGDPHDANIYGHATYREGHMQRRILFIIGPALLGALTLGAQQNTTPKPAAKPQAKEAAKPAAKEDEAALRKQAKVTEAAAKATALAAVPGATVKSGELEKEKGKLIWSFDLTVPGKKGIEEVNVDAMTGKVIAKEHEDAKAEKAEAKAEMAEKKANAPAKKP